MSRRPPAREPRLAGYEFIRHLGSGGFADVFLYTDIRTNREVAVKVLLADSLSPGVRDQFESEARLMGQLSTHPSIVTVYNTGIAPDGRPYLVMEYCSEPSLGERFRTRPIDIPRALELTVEISGAVETAHRAGILHRDIKPANILISDYGKAMLTDFGIAGALGGSGGEQGLSVPWAPPEFIEGEPGGRESDVWSLAATLYSLLEGRAPFELPGQDRSAEAQMHRILHEQLPPMVAINMPPVLEQTIAAAMAKDPGARFASALEFGNALRRVQTSLRLPESTLLVRSPRKQAQHDTPATPAAGHGDEDPDGTRVRPNVVVHDPHGRSQSVSHQGSPVGRFVPGDNPSSAGVGAHDADAATRSRVRPPGPLSESPDSVNSTYIRGQQPAANTESTSSKVGVRTLAGLVAGLAIVGVVAWAFLTGDNDDAPSADSSVVEGPAEPTPPPRQPRAPVPAVENATASTQGNSSVFRWDNPDPQDGDRYLWIRTDTGTAEQPRETDVTEVTLDGVANACIEVSLVRENGRTSANAVEVCVK